MFRSEVTDKFKGFENSIRSLLVENILKTIEYDQVNECFEVGPNESLQRFNSKTTNIKNQCSALLYMLENKYFKEAFILHEKKSDDENEIYNNPPSGAFSMQNVDDLTKFWANLGNIFKLQPLQDIRDYFGEYVAFYFSFAGVLISSLWIPSLLGILFFVIEIVQM